MTEDSTPTTRWRERTVERSLKGPREKAIARGDKFIAAATDLLRSGESDFTVQDIVEHSGMSLRSFYHHFATKDDLLLALIEETMQHYIEEVRPLVEAEPDPIQKLTILLHRSFNSQESDNPASRVLVPFHWHLADVRPHEFAATLIPQVDLLSEIISAGVDAGVFRTDVSVSVLASLLTNTLLSLLDMRVFGVNLADEPMSVDDFILWCLAAVGATSGE
jgi:AcrR family transcriptional regulator